MSYTEQKRASFGISLLIGGLLTVLPTVEMAALVSGGYDVARPVCFLIFFIVFFGLTIPAATGGSPGAARSRLAFGWSEGVWRVSAAWILAVALFSLVDAAALSWGVWSSPQSLSSPGAEVVVLLLLTCACGGYAAFVEPFRVKVTKLKAPVTGLPAEFDGLRIVHLSDLHVGPLVSDRQLDRWMVSCLEQEPDLVVFTGDLTLGGGRHLERAARWLGMLPARLGTFAVMGNHDMVRAEQVEEALAREGIELLRNESVVLGQGTETLLLAGVDDPEFGRDDFKAALEGAPGGRPMVALAHDPRSFEAASDAGADLVLCGHTHGGQLSFPGAPRWLRISRLQSRYVMGAYRKGSTLLYVSSGLGCTGMPLRWGAPPEIPVMILLPAEERRIATTRSIP